MTIAADKAFGIATEWTGFATGFTLALARISCLFVFAPVFSSQAIPPRIKAGLSLAIAFLVAPAVAAGRERAVELTVTAVTGELAAGLAMGVSLSLVMEAIQFAAALMSMEFSFSLANLLDPNSLVETPVLGQMFGWVGMLIVLCSGIHRLFLDAVVQSFVAFPAGHVTLHALAGAEMAKAAGGLFTVGLRLASPVVAVGLSVEITVALVGRMALQLPANVLSVPLKTALSYVVLTASLSVWPWVMERQFGEALLRSGKWLVRL